MDSWIDKKKKVKRNRITWLLRQCSTLHLDFPKNVPSITFWGGSLVHKSFQRFPIVVLFVLWLDKIWSSSSEAIMLTWNCALGCHHDGSWFSSSSSEEAYRYWAKIDWYLELSMIPAYLDQTSVPVEEGQNHCMMLPPPCFSYVVLWVIRFLILESNVLCQKKVSALVSSEEIASV